MGYNKIIVPEGGERIDTRGDKLHVPNNPYLVYIEGDGIGPDIMQASLQVWDAAVKKAYGDDRKVHWVEVYAGEKAAARYDGDYFPGELLEAIREFTIGVKGPLTTPVGCGHRSLNITLRQQLDMYACVRPIRYFPGMPSPLRHPEDVDVVLFREATEDVLAGIEYQSGTSENEKLARFLREELGASFRADAGLGIKPISPVGSKRLIRKGIQYAIDYGRQSVTIMHKGNVQKYTEGAFRAWGYELAREEFSDVTITEAELWEAPYNGKPPEGKIVIKDRIADIMFQMMLLRPSEFDVIVMPNLNGDYLSNAVAAQVGGVGIAPGANIGDMMAVFEATHGSAPKYASQDKVNPGSLLFSGAMMFDHIGWKEVASLITRAYERTVADKIVTYDFARQLPDAREVGTTAFAHAIIARL